MSFEFADAPPAPQILAAVYTAGQLETVQRRTVMTLLRSATSWMGGSNGDLILWLTGHAHAGDYGLAGADPLGWALDVFGLESDAVSKREVQKRFRRLLRAAHPDHGGQSIDAAAAIDRISEARRILLATAS